MATHIHELTASQLEHPLPPAELARRLLLVLDELLADSDDVDDGKLPEISGTTLCRARQASAIAHAALAVLKAGG